VCERLGLVSFLIVDMSGKFEEIACVFQKRLEGKMEDACEKLEVAERKALRAVVCLAMVRRAIKSIRRGLMRIA